MPNRIKTILAEKLGKFLDAEMSEEETAQVEADLNAQRANGSVQVLLQGGYINADPETQAAARSLAAHDVAALELLLKSPRPAPAQVVTMIDPNKSTDPTQKAIEARMQAEQIPYHEAALRESVGGDLQA